MRAPGRRLHEALRFGKIGEALQVVGLYRDEIEADFAAEYPGENFEELWRRRRFRKLLSLIGQLPRNSRYKEALSKDERLAGQIADMPGAADGPPGKWRPDWRDFGLTEELLLMLVNEVKQTAAALGGGKPVLLDGPERAIDKIMLQRARNDHDRIVGMLLPHKATKSN